MKLNVLLKTKEYRCDHDAEVTHAIDISPTQPIGDLIFAVTKAKGEMTPTDVLEIRIIREPNHENQP